MLGASINVGDFGDLIVNVVPATTAGAVLDLIPVAPGGTITEENGTTVITVEQGTTVNVTARVLSTPNDTPIQTFQLGFRDSSPELVLNNFVNGDFLNTIDETLDSTVGDRVIGSAIADDQQELVPPQTFGTFDVGTPQIGRFTLTAMNSGPPETTQTQIGDMLGASINVGDFGDLIFVVTAPAALPTVNVTVSPTSVIEDGAANLVYTFTRTGDLSAPLTVNYATSGTADSTDFTGAGPSVVIPANAASATVTIDPTPDTIDESDETVILTISPNAGVYNVGASATATGSIIDDDDVSVPVLPTVAVSVAPVSVIEDGAANLVYTFTRTGGDLSAPLTVNYTTSGTADSTDFTGAGPSVVIPANAASATVTIDPTADTIDESDETVILTISPNAGVYNVGASAAATGSIIDDDDAQAPVLPTVSVSVTPASVFEDGAANLNYTFTRSGGDNSLPLTVVYTTTGTATAGVDFSGTQNDVVIPAGQDSVTVIVNPTVDFADEDDETVILTISPNSAYDIGSSFSATGIILDDDIAGAVENRIVVINDIARAFTIPGDNRPTAVLFRAESNAELSVIPIGTSSFSESVILLDQDLNTLQDSATGDALVTNILGDSLYALIFSARSTETFYLVQSSAGFDSLTGSVNTNLFQPADVNADGEATPIDALMVINRLGAAEGEAAGFSGYYDVNGDNQITAIDALQVINELQRNNTTAEGEAIGSIASIEVDDRDDYFADLTGLPDNLDSEILAAAVAQSVISQNVPLQNIIEVDDADARVDEAISVLDNFDELVAETEWLAS